MVNNSKVVLNLRSNEQPYASVLCQFTEYSYNLSKLGNLRNAKSDTKTDTNGTTCKKKFPLESGFVNNAERWT
jgi:hypothetical protein